MGFLRYIEVAQRVPQYLTAAAHYLFSLAVAFRRDKLMDLQIRKRLPEIVGPMSPFISLLEGRYVLPEVAQIVEVSTRLILPSRSGPLSGSAALAPG